MPRINLTVELLDIDQVKALGAKWHDENKICHVPHDISAEILKKWLSHTNYNIKSDFFYIARSYSRCWKCLILTPIFCFAVSPSAIFLTHSNNDQQKCRHNLQDTLTFISHLTAITPNAENIVKKMTSKFFLDFSDMSHSEYWMNHCEACGTKQDDSALYHGTDAVFNPKYESSIYPITLFQFNEYFACSGNAPEDQHIVK